MKRISVIIIMSVVLSGCGTNFNLLSLTVTTHIGNNTEVTNSNETKLSNVQDSEEVGDNNVDLTKKRSK